MFLPLDAMQENTASIFCTKQECYTMKKIATVIGGTGLIGRHLIEQLQQHAEFTSIRVLVRRDVHFSASKVHSSVIDFNNTSLLREHIQGSNAVFCCIGTTLKKVQGDMKLYRFIDHDIPLRTAIACQETACPHYLFVSSVGANSASSNFYLRLKGEVEDSLRKLAIPSVSVFRPSMLLGKREEFRFAEQIGQVAMKAFSWCIPSIYKPIEASLVAKAMAQTSVSATAGFQILHYKEMIKI